MEFLGIFEVPTDCTRFFSVALEVMVLRDVLLLARRNNMMQETELEMGI